MWFSYNTILVLYSLLLYRVSIQGRDVWYDAMSININYCLYYTPETRVVSSEDRQIMLPRQRRAESCWGKLCVFVEPVGLPAFTLLGCQSRALVYITVSHFANYTFHTHLYRSILRHLSWTYITWIMYIYWLVMLLLMTRRSESTNHDPPPVWLPPDVLRLTVVLRRSGSTCTVSPWLR